MNGYLIRKNLDYNMVLSTIFRITMIVYIVFLVEVFYISNESSLKWILILVGIMFVYGIVYIITRALNKKNTKKDKKVLIKELIEKYDKIRYSNFFPKTRQRLALRLIYYIDSDYIENNMVLSNNDNIKQRLDFMYPSLIGTLFTILPNILFIVYSIMFLFRFNYNISQYGNVFVGMFIFLNALYIGYIINQILEYSQKIRLSNMLKNDSSLFKNKIEKKNEKNLNSLFPTDKSELLEIDYKYILEKIERMEKHEEFL